MVSHPKKTISSIKAGKRVEVSFQLGQRTRRPHKAARTSIEADIRAA